MFYGLFFLVVFLSHQFSFRTSLNIKLNEFAFKFLPSLSNKWTSFFLSVFKLADIHLYMQINVFANECFLKSYEQVLKH